MNIKNLLKIKADILARPDLLFMSLWYLPSGGCGTAACLAGHAAAYQRSTETDLERRLNCVASVCLRVFPEGKRFLGLTTAQAQRLFFMREHHFSIDRRWPLEFDEAYHRARSDKGRAKVAARRIDHFIKTKGKE